MNQRAALTRTHRPMLKLLQFALLLLSLPGLPADARAQTACQPQPARRFTWQGEYVGIQRIADMRRPFKDGGYGVTFLTLVGLPGKLTGEFQLIFPINGATRYPVYRIGISRRFL